MITLNPSEKLIKVIRRHTLAFLIESFILFVAAIAPIIFYKIDTLLFGGLYFGFAGTSFLAALGYYGLWLVILSILGAVAVSDHYLDIWILTDKRIIDVRQTAIFSREIHSLKLSDIVEASLIEQNSFQKKHNYGTIVVKSKDSRHILVEEVPSPEKVRVMIHS
ncbi:MAG: PH domain-containing protein [Candidatus Pacebacteria bacterium]|nr:PH domain-containing protein [Candidatus Paceibacterota bacterium]